MDTDFKPVSGQVWIDEEDNIYVQDENYNEEYEIYVDYLIMEQENLWK